MRARAVAPALLSWICALPLAAQNTTLPLRDVFRRVRPAVVVIATRQKELAPDGRSGYVDTRGEVVGIVSALLSKSGGFEGLALATPLNVARSLVLEGKGFWTGVDGYLVDGEMARVLNLPQAAGFLVERVAGGREDLEAWAFIEVRHRAGSTMSPRRYSRRRSE